MAQMKAVFTVNKYGEDKKRWTRIGVAFVNKDGSLNVKLDALPVNGELHIRDQEAKEDKAGTED